MFELAFDAKLSLCFHINPSMLKALLKESATATLAA